MKEDQELGQFGGSGADTGFKGGGARLISEQKIFRFRNKKRAKFF